MGLARDLLRGVRQRLLDRWGERIVRNLADTSADAPSNFAQPKRDLYEQLKEEGKLDEAKRDR
jgi:hypothetical protein